MQHLLPRPATDSFEVWQFNSLALVAIANVRLESLLSLMLMLLLLLPLLNFDGVDIMLLLSAIRKQLSWLHFALIVIETHDCFKRSFIRSFIHLLLQRFSLHCELNTVVVG